MAVAASIGGVATLAGGDGLWLGHFPNQKPRATGGPWRTAAGEPAPQGECGRDAAHRRQWGFRPRIPRLPPEPVRASPFPPV